MQCPPSTHMRALRQHDAGVDGSGVVLGVGCRCGLQGVRVCSVVRCSPRCLEGVPAWRCPARTRRTQCGMAAAAPSTTLPFRPPALPTCQSSDSDDCCDRLLRLGVDAEEREPPSCEVQPMARRWAGGEKTARRQRQRRAVAAVAANWAAPAPPDRLHWHCLPCRCLQAAAPSALAPPTARPPPPPSWSLGGAAAGLVSSWRRSRASTAALIALHSADRPRQPAARCLGFVPITGRCR